MWRRTTFAPCVPCAARVHIPHTTTSVVIASSHSEGTVVKDRDPIPPMMVIVSVFSPSLLPTCCFVGESRSVLFWWKFFWTFQQRIRHQWQWLSTTQSLTLNTNSMNLTRIQRIKRISLFPTINLPKKDLLLGLWSTKKTRDQETQKWKLIWKFHRFAFTYSTVLSFVSHWKNHTGPIYIRPFYWSKSLEIIDFDNYREADLIPRQKPKEWNKDWGWRRWWIGFKSSPENLPKRQG